MPVLDGRGVYREMQADPKLADIVVVVTTSDPSRAPAGPLTLKKSLALPVLLGVARRCCSEAAARYPETH